jgi:hypothetical protein
MTLGNQDACPAVAAVEHFFKATKQKPGEVEASVLLETDVYVRWHTERAPTVHSRVLPFETPAHAEKAVRLLTVPEPASF